MGLYPRDRAGKVDEPSPLPMKTWLARSNLRGRALLDRERTLIRARLGEALDTYDATHYDACGEFLDATEAKE